MKRFKIEFPVSGVTVELFAEAMDTTDTRFSVERSENDPHPLLLEFEQETEKWKATSGDKWSLTDEEINDLGCKLKQEARTGDPVFTGIHAK